VLVPYELNQSHCGKDMFVIVIVIIIVICSGLLGIGLRKKDYD